MRPDLPWNVAGIPSEARDAARAAARREGLSVGEWLTRRIIRSFAGETESYEPMRETYSPPPAYRSAAAEEPTYRRAEEPLYRRPEEPAPSARAADTSDLLARVSRNDSETQDIYRRIETHLGGLGRRLEATERNTAENNRAMSKAATEINIAAREQTQAFDQLSAHVVSLTERLSRVEQAGGNDNMKEAIKTLHQGLEHLADQIGLTSRQSATQIEALANNLESAVTKIAEVRDAAEAAQHALDQRMAMLDDRVRSVERASHSSADLVDKALQQRMGMLDERVRVIERVSHASADALDKALENMEARNQQRSQESADINRRVGSIEHLHDALDRITSRFASSEAQTATAIARIEDNLLRLDSRGSDPAIDRRLNSIERTLGDIVAKFDGASSTDENIRRLASRMDSMEKQHDDAVLELRSLHSLNTAAAPKSEPAPVAAMQPVFAAQQPTFTPAAPSAPVFDAPPFPEVPPVTPTPDPFADAFAPVFAPPPHAADGSASVFGEFAPQAQFAGPTTFDAAGFAPTDAAPPPATNESFLAAARRSARAAAEQADGERSRGFGSFSWGSTPAEKATASAAAFEAPPVATPMMPMAETVEEDKPKSGRTRYLLIGAIALIVILAAVSIILSQRAGVTQAEQHNGIGTLFSNAKKPATAPAVEPKMAPVPYTPDDQVPNYQVPDAAQGQGNDSFSAVPPKAGATAPKAGAPVAGTQAAVQPPKTTTLDKLTQLANAGNAKAELLVALKYIDGDGVPVNEAEGAKWLQKAAAQNEPVAAYRMGTLYERGKGVTADAAKATHWYQIAAQAGNRKAMHNLAVAYAQGSGTQKNFAEAARWFSKAAALGLSDSQFNLAVLYERGLGVPQSLLDAYKWYAIAAAQGDNESKTRIDALATQLSADDRAAAQRSAGMFKPQALDRRANATPDIADVTRG